MNDNILTDSYDVIIIGTGVGGATIGYKLAKAGVRVLFCESGNSNLIDNKNYRGHYAEYFAKKNLSNSPEYHDIFKSCGRWSEKIQDNSTTKTRRFIPLLGIGTGGSSSLYGMAMERFFSSDFSPRKNYPTLECGNLPETWPISYEELEPFYHDAELLYQIKGTKDPLRMDQKIELSTPSALTNANNELFNFFIKKNLHPYRLPLACELKDDCKGCQGYLCSNDCKNDSQKICLEPAIKNYGATLLDSCHVIKLESNDNKVTGVHCIWKNKKIILNSEIVILAAGALKTPQILLNSSSKDWPFGLANESGLVGKNLMRHFVDLYAIATKSKHITGHMKDIAINDFYFKNDLKLGTIQSFGHLPPPSVLVDSIEQELKEKSKIFGFIFKLTKPITQIVLSWLLSNKVILVSIIEDLPYLDNQVLIDKYNDELIIKYKLSLSSKRRIKKSREIMHTLLKPYKFIPLLQAESNDRIAHACGTCRFGTDPKDSVLNSVNRAHNVLNLYIVDSSFFPSSAGTNPSLTIAANALRVAEYLINNALKKTARNA